LHYLTFWQGALALAAVPLLHWAILNRTLAVSGRFSAVIDRLRSRKPSGAAEAPMTEADLLALIQAETRAAFGAEAIEEARVTVTKKLPIIRPPDSSAMHVLFFVGLALGGLVSTLIAGSFQPSLWLRGDLFASFVGASPASRVLVPLAGGLLIGFGTRMAGGCTSGHGLCGLSQFQPGSLVATIGFFGMGVLVSLVIGTLT
jgi:uncharacterized protein